MTGGFATVAGGVMAAYVGFLEQSIPTIAGHLVAASIMSAPAALAISKVMYPMPQDTQVIDEIDLSIEEKTHIEMWLRQLQWVPQKE